MADPMHPIAAVEADIPLDLLNKVKEEAFRLPQGRLLTEERIEKWARAVYAIEPKRILWHIRRAGGWGGSEIGNLVAWEAGIYDVWATPHDLVRSKLLLSMPVPAQEDAQRGLIMESYIRHLAECRIPGLTRDTKALEAVRAGRHKDLPWMIGQPDDIVLLDGLRLEWDYKAPKPHIFKGYIEKGISLEYRAQLSHYRQIGESLGVTFDGVANVFSNADALEMHAYHWFDATQSNPGLKLADYRPGRFPDDFVIIEHLPDPELDLAVRTAGEKYWNQHVLLGDVPPIVSKPRIYFEGGMPPGDLVDAFRKHAKLSVLKSQIEEEHEQSRDNISGMIRNIGSLEDGKLELSIVTASEKRELDLDEMATRLDAIGVDREAMTSPAVLTYDDLLAILQKLSMQYAFPYEATLEAFPRPRVPDEGKIAELFRKYGFDPNPHTKQKITLMLPRARQGQIAESLVATKERGRQVVKDTADKFDVSATENLVQARAEKDREKAEEKAAAAQARADRKAARENQPATPTPTPTRSRKRPVDEDDNPAEQPAPAVG